jgi:hypothetical protein
MEGGRALYLRWWVERIAQSSGRRTSHTKKFPDGDAFSALAAVGVRDRDYRRPCCVKARRLTSDAQLRYEIVYCFGARASHHRMATFQQSHHMYWSSLALDLMTGR